MVPIVKVEKKMSSLYFLIVQMHKTVFTTTIACSLIPIKCSMIETVQASTCSKQKTPVMLSTTAIEICTYRGES